jgi:Dimethyladenosine transferase (rRNA methylation)
MKKPSHIRAKKHLSQNFLTDENVIKKIISSFDLKKDDHVIEIGPGYGAMTFPIMEIVDSIDVIELDKNLANHLKDHDQKKSINVIHKDALSFDFTSLKKKEKFD